MYVNTMQSVGKNSSSTCLIVLYQLCCANRRNIACESTLQHTINCVFWVSMKQQQKRVSCPGSLSFFSMVFLTQPLSNGVSMGLVRWPTASPARQPHQFENSLTFSKNFLRRLEPLGMRQKPCTCSVPTLM